MEAANPIVVTSVAVIVIAIIFLTIRDTQECTALIKGVHDRNMTEIRSLLASGHAIDCQDRDGWTPLCHAAKLSYNDVTMEFLHKGSDPVRPLFIAAEYDSYTVVNALIMYGADPNLDYMGQTALHIAVKKSHRSTINILLEREANTNLRYMSRTPLYYAMEVGDHGVVSTLLKHKADPNIPDEVGRTPLHIAVEREDAWGVSILLEFGADYDKQYKSRTPLQLAEERGLKTISKLLRTADEEKKKLRFEKKGSFR